MSQNFPRTKPTSKANTSILQWFQGVVFVENASLTLDLRFVFLQVFFRADPRNRRLLARESRMLWSCGLPGGWAEQRQLSVGHARHADGADTLPGSLIIKRTGA